MFHHQPMDPMWSAAAALVVYVLMTGYMWRVRPTVFALQCTFTPAQFTGVAGRWSADDLRRVRGHFALDYPFIVLYGAFGYWWIAGGSIWSDAPALRLTTQWLLPIAAAADAIENLLHLFLLGRIERPAARGWYMLAGSVVALKFGAFAAFVASVLLASTA